MTCERICVYARQCWQRQVPTHQTKHNKPNSWRSTSAYSPVWSRQVRLREGVRSVRYFSGCCCYNILRFIMTFKGRKSSTKNPPFLSHEFVIQNHADIVSCFAMIFVVGLMIQVSWTDSMVFSLVGLIRIKWYQVWEDSFKRNVNNIQNIYR